MRQKSLLSKGAAGLRKRGERKGIGSGGGKEGQGGLMPLKKSDSSLRKNNRSALKKKKSMEGKNRKRIVGEWRRMLPSDDLKKKKVLGTTPQNAIRRGKSRSREPTRAESLTTPPSARQSQGQRFVSQNQERNATRKGAWRSLSKEGGPKRKGNSHGGSRGGENENPGHRLVFK